MLFKILFLELDGYLAVGGVAWCEGVVDASQEAV